MLPSLLLIGVSPVGTGSPWVVSPSSFLFWLRFFPQKKDYSFDHITDG